MTKLTKKEFIDNLAERIQEIHNSLFLSYVHMSLEIGVAYRTLVKLIDPKERYGMRSATMRRIYDWSRKKKYKVNVRNIEEHAEMQQAQEQE